MAPAPQTNPGEICFWPILKIDYRTDADKIAALLPPGIDAGDEPIVHLSIYNVPVPDEPEYGVLITVDAKYRDEVGEYAIGYGIDQESAIMISHDMNGQPKYPCDTTYFRMFDAVTARCSHQGYTFLEFTGKTTGQVTETPEYSSTELWVKHSRAVGGAEKAYDFPPHVVKVVTTYSARHLAEVEGTLTLRDSPWDPILELLPMREQLKVNLDTSTYTDRQITLEAPIDPEAFWPFVDTIGGSRWPGESGGPRRKA